MAELLFDDFLEERLVPDEPQEAKLKKKDIEQEAKLSIKGNFAISQAGSLGDTKPPEDNLFADFLEPQEKSIILHDQDEIPNAIKKDQEQGALFEEFLGDATEFKANAYEPKTGTGFTKTALTILSVDEHAIVAGVNKLLGNEAHEDFSENTWTNLLRKQIGQDIKVPYGELSPLVPDTISLDAMGLALSIFASPLTYLTFGTGGAVKVAAKGVGKAALTKQGKALVNKIAKDKTEKFIATKLGGAATREQRNIVARRMIEDVEKDVVKKFKSIQEGTSKIKISKEVSKLPNTIYDPGGIKFAGKQVVTGAQVMKVLDKAGVTDVARAAIQTKPGQYTQMKLIDPVKGGIQEVKDFAGKLFVHRHKFDKELIDGWIDVERKAAATKRRIEHRTAQWFGGMSKAERFEFSDLLIKASQNPKKVIVTSSSGSRAVQKRLDKWLGQGQFKGRGIADQLAEKSKLLEDNKLANWFPGIDRRFEHTNLTVPTKLTPARRDFLLRRKPGVDPRNYVRDPIKAISTRRTQIAYANLQDELYDSIVKKKIGDVKTFKTPLEADAAGYAPIRRPMHKLLFESDHAQKRFKDAPVYAKKEFVEQYNKIVRDQKIHVPIISPATQLFKAAVTGPFPGFHARNFNSNIVLNSMSIGRHAVDPKKHKLALNMIREKGMDVIFKTDIGEELTLKQLKREAADIGVIDIKNYQADLGGEALSGEARNLWETITKRLNPLSANEFVLYREGRKVGQAIESQARLVNYMTWRQKGLSPKLAKAEVDAALFDYGALTRFEEGAKLLIPFYSFTKNNLIAQAKLFSHRPGAVAAQLKAFRDLGPTDDEWEEMPEWVRRRFVARINGTFSTGFGLPFEDIMELAGSDGREVILRTNPMFRYGLERAVQKDFFSDRDIKSVNGAKEFTMALDMANDETMPWVVRQSMGEVVKFLKLERDPSNPKKVIGDPDKLHILRSSFTSRFQSMVGQLENEEKTGFDAALNFTTGVTRLTPDAEKVLSFARKRFSKELDDIILETNTARGIGGSIYFGGTKENRKIINWYLQQRDNATRPRQLERLLEQARKEFEEQQRLRTTPRAP